MRPLGLHTTKPSSRHCDNHLIMLSSSNDSEQCPQAFGAIVVPLIILLKPRKPQFEDNHVCIVFGLDDRLGHQQ